MAKWTRLEGCGANILILVVGFHKSMIVILLLALTTFNLETYKERIHLGRNDTILDHVSRESSCAHMSEIDILYLGGALLNMLLLLLQSLSRSVAYNFKISGLGTLNPLGCFKL